MSRTLLGESFAGADSKPTPALQVKDESYLKVTGKR